MRRWEREGGGSVTREGGESDQGRGGGGECRESHKTQSG